jgi:hypothetical protein
METNPRPFILKATVAAVERHFEGWEVRPHPQGGFTIARPVSPNSSTRLYVGGFATKGAGEFHLNKLKMNAIAKVMSGVPLAAIFGEGEPANQTVLFT